MILTAVWAGTWHIAQGMSPELDDEDPAADTINGLLFMAFDLAMAAIVFNPEVLPV